MPSTLSKPLGVRIPHADLARLEALAEQSGETRGALATEALLRGLGLLEAERTGVAKPQDAETPSMQGVHPSGNPQMTAPDINLERFSRQVLESAKRSKTRKANKIGDDNRFIVDAWRQYQKDHGSAAPDLETFKQRLVEANRSRHLSLGCCDMQGFMNRADVEQSEIRINSSAAWHLIKV